MNPFVRLMLDEEAEFLAEKYIDKHIIPERKFEDALHLAIASTNEMDCLVSWNYKHMANINIERKINIVNNKNGYHYPIRLTTPMGVMD